MTIILVRTLSFTYSDPPLIQWMITIINGRKKTNQDLQVHLCEEMISLSGEVRLGKQVLRLSGAKFDQEWSRARLGVKTFA